MSSEIDLEQLKRMLPELVRTNDELKGAIISALSGVVATKEDIQRVIQQSNQQFFDLRKEMDERFVSMQKQMDERFNNTEKKIDELRVEVLSLANKTGPEFEWLVLKLMKETLLLNNINPDKIRKETLMDSKGELFALGFSTDIDVLLENGNVYLVEVKAKADSRDFYHFKRIAMLYEQETGKKVSGLIMVSLRINEKTIVHGKNTGIKIVAGSIIYGAEEP